MLETVCYLIWVLFAIMAYIYVVNTLFSHRDEC